MDNFDNYYDVSLKETNIKSFIANPNYKCVIGSILDHDLVNNCMIGVDYVFHNAAQAGVRESIKDPMKTHLVNTTGTLNILESAKKSKVKKVIFASSSSVYGNSINLPFNELHPTNPISPYGVSKLCAEKYCETYRSLFGLNTVSLRYFTVFGARIRPDLAISIFAHRALEGKEIIIFGDGDKSRDFTYIDNIVNANVLAMDHGSGVYNIGGGHGITITELAKSIIDITKSSSKIIYKENVQGDMEHTLADISKAYNELGYSPNVNITDGLECYIKTLTN